MVYRHERSEHKSVWSNKTFALMEEPVGLLSCLLEQLATVRGLPLVHPIGRRQSQPGVEKSLLTPLIKLPLLQDPPNAIVYHLADVSCFCHPVYPPKS